MTTRTKDLPPLLAEQALKQEGLVTRQQALDTGLSADAISRRIRRGTWQRVMPLVYAVNGAPRTWMQRVVATWLWAPDGAISHLTAAAIWKFEGCKRGPIELTIPHRRQHPDIKVHVASLGRGEAGRLDAIRITSPTRTLVDLASVVAERPLARALMMHFGGR